MTLLHTNDVHARYAQFNKYGSSCSESQASDGECFGGYARLAGAVKSMRAQHPHSLLLDGGDQYQGTLWFYQYGHSVTSHFMNWVQYDVMAIGNHEFDRELAGLVPFLQAANFSVVSANIDASLEPEVGGLFAKSAERVVAGRRVGVVGYTTVDTPLISSPGRLQFSDVVTAVRREVERLLADGVQVIIALGHAGFDVDLLVGQIPGVDVVIGGHTNTFLYTGEPPSNEVPSGVYPTVVTRADGRALVAQCFTWAKYLCALHVTFDDDGNVVSYSGNPQLLDSTVEQDNATLAELEPWKEALSNMSRKVVGRSLVKLEGDRQVCRMGECNLGNLIADGMIQQNLRHPDELRWNHVSIAMVNSGGIRATLGRGDISIADVKTVLPFDNTLDAIEMKGEHLRAALEHSVSRLDPCDTANLFGGFLQVSGLRVTYDMRRPVGERVASLHALCTRCEVPDYEPVRDEQVYKIITSSFIIRGGDGYTVLRDNLVSHDLLGDVDSDVFMEYLKAASPVYPGLEGRIQYLHNSDVCDASSSSSGAPGASLALVLVTCLLWFRSHWSQ